MTIDVLHVSQNLCVVRAGIWDEVLAVFGVIWIDVVQGLCCKSLSDDVILGAEVSDAEVVKGFS